MMRLSVRVRVTGSTELPSVYFLRNILIFGAILASYGGFRAEPWKN